MDWALRFALRCKYHNILDILYSFQSVSVNSFVCVFWRNTHIEIYCRITSGHNPSPNCGHHRSFCFTYCFEVNSVGRTRSNTTVLNFTSSVNRFCRSSRYKFRDKKIHTKWFWKIQRIVLREPMEIVLSNRNCVR